MNRSKSIYEKTLGYVLTLYIGSVIIFFQNYNWVTYLMGGMLIAVFFLLIIVKKNSNIKFNAVIVCYGLFSFLAIVSSFWAVSFDTSMSKSFQMLYILFNMYIIYTSIKIYDLERQFMYGILLGALANYILLLSPLSVPFEIYSDFRAVGTLGNANVLAILMNFSIVVTILYIILYKPKRLFLIYLSANFYLSLYIIFLTASKKGLTLASIIVILFIIMNIKSIKNVVVISVLGLLTLLVFQKSVDQAGFIEQVRLLTIRFTETISVLDGRSQGGSTGERINFIKLGVNLFEERPLFGFGVDNFRMFSNTYSHNNYIEVLVGLGIIGFLILISMYLSVLYKMSKIKNNFLKYILLITMIALMLLDMAMVSYSIKMILFFILFLSIVAENNIKNQEAIQDTI